MDRRFEIFFTINDPADFPETVIRNISLQDYIKIKHINNFAYNFLINYIQNNNVIDVNSITKMWISTDDVDYKIIFDIDNPSVHTNTEYV